jgi:DNA-binding SARP family transcriptional activator
MEFRILGPLELIEDGRSIELGGQKQRTLLASLLLEPNRVVARDRLVDALWEDAPPETAQKALQVHVSQLRKLLGGRLQTKAPGYLLRVERDELDVDRFQTLLDQREYRRALALWRGPPLAEFADTRFAASEIARLDELRLTCLEERIDEDLAAARQAAVVGELESLVADHPLRERLRGQLMLAFYRCGRQGEALAAYRDARHALVEELGIEPGKALRDLQQRILNQEAELDLEDDPPAPTPVAQAAPVPAAKERKLATALFADVVGSTAIGDDDPERFRLFLERFYAAVADEVAAAGGTIEKFAGDAVMAAFGAPAAHEDHVERALHAALAMQRRVRAEFGETVTLRIGVNTGDVVVGGPREGSSFMSGDIVNVAARLEQAATPGEILVGERAASLAGDAFEFGPPNTVEARGKPGGVVCRPLHRALTQARPRGVRGLRDVFVGRESELDLLTATYRHTVGQHEPHLVTIVGDTGVGKTSVARELANRLRAEMPEPILRSGRCLPYGRGVTYWPLGEILKEQLGILDSDSPDQVRARLAASEILGLTLGLEPSHEIHPLVAREQLNEAWIDLLERLVAERPTILVVEDLHWAEEPLLDLIERLSRDVLGPLLLIATARPELLDRRPGWGSGRRNTAVVSLEPLSTSDTVRMAEELLATAMPPALHRLVLATAEGNPFFVEELLSALIDHGVLARNGETWRLAGETSTFAVPDSVHSAVAARVDLLEPEQKAALRAASVVGRVFWLGPVKELLGDVDLDVRTLEERDFIRRRAASTIAGEREYAFKHGVTREVAYAGLPLARRARLHASFAEWLERVGEGRDEHAPLLAHHYAEAVHPGHSDLAWGDDAATLERLRARALTWLLRAAALAEARYAVDEQIGLLRQAVGIENAPDERGRLWRSIARAAALNYDDAAFLEATQHAIETTKGAVEVADVLGEAAFNAAVRWQKEDDRARIDEWSRRVLELPGANGEARARALIARAVCKPDEAETAAREAAAIAAQLGDPEVRSFALYITADLALAAMEYTDACLIVDERLELLDAVADPDHRADAYWAALPAYLGCGRFADARRIAALHDEVTTSLTPHHRLHGIAAILEVEQLAGNWETVRELTPRAERAVDQNTTRCLHNRLAILVCALANAYLGDEEEARRLELRSDASGVDRYGRVETSLWLALHRRDLDAVERLLAEQEQPRQTFLRSRKLAPVAARLDALAALGRADDVEREAPQLLRPGTYLEPFALRALGVVREDAKQVDAAAQRFTEMSLTWHGAQTRALLTVPR